MDMDVDGKDRAPGSSLEALQMTVISSEEGQFVPVPNLSTAEYSVKIGLTLYKVQQNIYLLDFQKMTGDAFSFMTLCANIITELKTLSAASKQAQQQALMAHQQQQQTVSQQQQQQQAMQQQAGRYPPHPAPPKS
jgi:5'-AMP-activated protein kinase catalytic alpha subunit